MMASRDNASESAAAGSLAAASAFGLESGEDIMGDPGASSGLGKMACLANS